MKKEHNKGAGHYSKSHPTITVVRRDRTHEPRPVDEKLGAINEGNSYSGPGMAAALPKGKGKQPY